MLRKSAGALLALLVAASSPLYGQERFGSLTGRVTDQTSGALPGVTVVTTNRTSGEARTFVTDANGWIRLPLVGLPEPQHATVLAAMRRAGVIE